jgi:cytochrome c nitrite reductase small subunit
MSNPGIGPPGPPTPPAASPDPPSDNRSRRTFYLNLALATVIGVVLGLGVYTFGYAEGLSYLSDDPSACVNCHIMRDQFESWNRSSHKAVAACNDCHTPHHNVVAKYTVKAINGFNHSYRFTFGNFHEPLRITGMNKGVAQENCVECHDTTVSQMHVSAEGEEVDCIKCHANVGHRTIE